MMLLSSFYRAVFLSWLLLAIVEESVTVSGQGVTVDLNGLTLPNNSLVDFDDIPDFYTYGGVVDDSVLNCRTDLEACCNAAYQNLPAPVGEWYYPNGTALPFDTSPGGGTTFRRNRGLMIVRLWRKNTPTERGRFHCELPDAQNVNQAVYVNILNIGPVTITASGGSSTGIAGTSFSLMCSATVEIQTDTPTPNFDWFFGTNNDSLPSGATPMATVMGNSYTSTLQFSPLQESHAGMYTCRLGSNARLAVNAMVTVNRPDITVTVSASGSTVLGQKSLTCNVTGDENLSSTRTYQWTRDNETMAPVWTNSNYLSFSPLSLSDAGRYTCNVTVSSLYLNSNAVASSSNSEDVMLEIPNPSVTVTSNPSSPILDGTDVTVSCAVEMAQGVVDSDLSLLMVDAQLSRDETPLTLTGPTLTGTTFTYTTQLYLFGRNDSGNYTCTATVRPRHNSTYLIGNGVKSAIIKVVTAPVSVRVTRDQPIPIRPFGSTVTLTCTVVLAEYVEGLTVNTKWTGPNGFSENEMAQRMGSTTTYTSTAMVSSFGRDQSGNYICTATVSSINVTVSSSIRVAVGVYLALKGVVYPNNSIISVTKIEQTDTTSNNGLQCITDRTPCCATPPNRHGEWFFPDNGRMVPPIVSATTFYRTRGNDGTVNLNRLNNDVMLPTGRFCCVVPDATGVSQWACAIILKSQQNMSLTSNLPNPILSGSNVTLTCTVELSSAVDVPVTVNTVWTGPTTESLNPSTTTQESLTLYRSTLVLKSVESANSGQYTCSAKVGSGDEISASADIEILDGLFQLRLKGVDICQQWYITRSSKEAIKYVNYIDMALVEATERHCKCHFPDDNLLEGSFSCEESPDLMTYRSAVVGTHNFNGSRIIGFIQDWVSSGPRIKIDRSHVRVDSSCPVALTSLDESECGL